MKTNKKEITSVTEFIEYKRSLDLNSEEYSLVDYRFASDLFLKGALIDSGEDQTLNAYIQGSKISVLLKNKVDIEINENGIRTSKGLNIEFKEDRLKNLIKIINHYSDEIYISANSFSEGSLQTIPKTDQELLEKIETLNPTNALEQIAELEYRYAERLLKENVIKYLSFPNEAAEKALTVINNLEKNESDEIKNVLNIFKTSVYQIFHILPILSGSLDPEKFSAEYNKDMKVKWKDGYFYIKKAIEKTFGKPEFTYYPVKYKNPDTIFHQIITSSCDIDGVKKKIEEQINKAENSDVESLLILMNKMKMLASLGKDKKFMEFVNEKRNEIIVLKLEKKFIKGNHKDEPDKAPTHKRSGSKTTILSQFFKIGIGSPSRKKLEIDGPKQTKS